MEWGAAIVRTQLGFVVFASAFFVSVSTHAQPAGAPGQVGERPALTPPPAALVIPPVQDRPLQATEGPRVRVSAFQLDVDPALGASIGSELRAELQRNLDDKVTSQPMAGYSIGELEAIAVDLTQRLRNGGFALASVYVPSQTVSGGQVKIATLPGSLGDVAAEGNDSYRVNWLASPFKKLQGQPVNAKELEGAILRVRDYPGVSTAAVLSPGKEVGSTDLTLRVREQPFEFGLTGDNYGSKFNGENRARAWAAWNNPLGHADRLYADVLQAFDPTENTYGSVSYITGLGSIWTGGIEYSTSSFDIDEDIRATYAGDPIDGEAEIFSIPLRAQVIRSRNLSLAFMLTYSHKTSSFDDVGVTQGTFKREDKEDVVGVSMDLQFVDEIFGASGLGVNGIRVGYDYGELDGDDEPGLVDLDGDGVPETPETCETTRVDGDGHCAAGSFSRGWLEVSRLQQLFTANSLLLSAYYQFSDDTLVSLEQLTLGGFYSVRAYPTSQELVDQGGFVRAEWHVDIHDLMARRPQAWDLSVFLAADYGDGKDNEPISGDQAAITMGGWGGGFQFQYRFGGRWAVEARMDVMTEAGDYDEPIAAGDDDDPRYWGWLSLSYR